MRKILFGFFLLISSTYAADSDNEKIAELSLQMFATQGDEKALVVRKLAALADKSLIPTFVLAMRWTGSNIHVAKALSDLTGEKITTWHEAYNWQELHPEIVPHASFHDLKLRFLGNTDAQFLELLKPFSGNQVKPRIRLEEIVWGGVQFDGIPSLDSAPMIHAIDADYLREQDLVFGVEINGDARAYPLRILGWHEMLNDIVGGVPVSLAYCTLCGSGVLYETWLENTTNPLIFGSSGLLYRSNKLMFDRSTQTLWNQFTGKPVIGPLATSGIELKARPMTITSWQSWRKQFPATKVLSLDTGYSRDYESGVAYREYFDSPDLMFPAIVSDESRLQRKDFIFGVVAFAASKAWPLDVFADTPVINDRVGNQSLVLIGDATTRTVRAYERDVDEKFSRSMTGDLTSASGVWVLT